MADRIIQLVPPAEPTPEELRRRQAGGYMDQANNLFGQIQALFGQIARFAWTGASDPSAATPQQVFDAFGTRAGDLFALANAYGALYATYTGAPPPSAVPDGWTYKIESDGRVTVTAPAVP